MKFCWCTVMVKNMEESLSFYHEIVGLPIGRRFKTPDGKEICFLGDGETEVELISDPRVSVSNDGKSIILGFEVDSLDRMLKFLKEKGIEIDGGIYQPNPNIKFFYVKDPNNVTIQFAENM